MNEPGSSPRPLRVTQLLLLTNALLWTGLGVASRIDPAAGGVSEALGWVISGLMFINALGFLGVAWGVGRGSRLLFWLGLVQVTVNLVLSVTDQIGLLDLVVLLLNAVLVGLMFARRKQFGVKW